MQSCVLGILCVLLFSAIAYAEGARPLPPTEKCVVNEGGGCLDCHPFHESDHAQALADRCVKCHGEQPPVDDALAGVCGECHKKYSMSRHPKLKHPLRSSNDPLRPGWPLDCASCHDPHAPDCLSCLNRAEQRQWCKECHATP